MGEVEQQGSWTSSFPWPGYRLLLLVWQVYGSSSEQEKLRYALGCITSVETLSVEVSESFILSLERTHVYEMTWTVGRLVWSAFYMCHSVHEARGSRLESGWQEALALFVEFFYSQNDIPQHQCMYLPREQSISSQPRSPQVGCSVLYLNSAQWRTVCLLWSQSLAEAIPQHIDRSGVGLFRGELASREMPGCCWLIMPELSDKVNESEIITLLPSQRIEPKL